MLDKDRKEQMSFEEFLPFYSSVKKQKTKEKAVVSRNAADRRRSQVSHKRVVQRDEIYLKLSSQRERMQKEAALEVSEMLKDISSRYKLDMKDLTTRYQVRSMKSPNESS